MSLTGEVHMPNEIVPRTEFIITAEVLADAKAADEELSAILKKKFPVEAGELSYHNYEHSERVGRDAQMLSELIADIDPTLISDRDIIVNRLLGKCHDIVQEGVLFDDADSPVKDTWVRFRGATPLDVSSHKESSKILSDSGDYVVGNEQASAQWAFEFFSERYPSLGITFAECQRKIAPTYPVFGFDETGLRVEQFYLTEDTHFADALVAMADLGESGLYEYKGYRKSSLAEFREVHQGIRLYLDAHNLEEIPYEVRAGIAVAAINWLKTDVTFIKWRKFYFKGFLDGAEDTVYEFSSGPRHLIIKPNEELANSPKAYELRVALHAKFSHFDDNIVGLQTDLTGLVDRYAGLPLSVLSEPGFGELKEQLAKKFADDSLFEEFLREIGY